MKLSIKLSIKLISILILLGYAGLSGLAFSADSSADHDVNKTASATAEGAPANVLFQKYCSICHGEKANGKSRVIRSMIPPPRDFTTPLAARELNRERMIESVTNGRPGTAMVSHSRKLSTQEIAAIVDYIRMTFMQLPENKQFVSANQTTAKDSASVSSKAVPQLAQKPAQSKQHQTGADLFKRNCASCHGDDGNTAIWARSGLNPAPRDFTTAQAASELTRERMIHSVTNGRPGTAMMSFTRKLSAEEIQIVVSYIRSEFMGINDDKQSQAVVAQTPVTPTPSADTKSAMPPVQVATGPADMDEPMPGSLKSDKAWGKEFYMNNCFVCHGKKGDGKGPRSHFITPRPRNFTSDESRESYNRPRLFNAIKQGKRGTVMPAWGTVLDDQQIANVAEFVFQSFILGKEIVGKKAHDEQSLIEKTHVETVHDDVVTEVKKKQLNNLTLMVKQSQ